jgi:hypothetical protein
LSSGALASCGLTLLTAPVVAKNFVQGLVDSPPDIKAEPFHRRFSFVGGKPVLEQFPDLPPSPFARLQSVPVRGKLLPRSILDKKVTEMPDFSAKTAWESRRSEGGCGC